MKIAIGCDHAGYEYKEAIKNMLEEKGHKVNDFGTFSTDSVDYPDFVHPTAESVESRESHLGVLICGSANGVAITANKHQGIRAAIAWEDELAALARQHNNANIICLPARFISLEKAKELTETFLSTDFEGGRHERRVNKIACQ
jgi:ribose 5-phosphate isomerase B